MNTARLSIVSIFLLALSSLLPAQGDLLVSWEQDDIICKEQAHASNLLSMRTTRNAYSDQTDIHY